MCCSTNSGTTSTMSRWLAGVLIGGLGLILLAAGCSKSDVNEAKEPQPDNVPAPEVVANPAPRIHEDPPMVSRPRDSAVFMGTHAQGQRFCIIADASNSMKGTPLVQLKKEILKTLYDLNPSSQFYVIFFNASAIPMPYPGWLSAEKENLDKVKPWVQNMSTLLKTLPNSAFERAFKLQPKPDVIFFMTDGFLQGPDPIAHLKTLNATEPKVAIHTIMFSRKKAAEAKGANKATTQLRVIAEKNGGVFRRVSQD
jgi:hypothetical protein